MYYKGLLWIFGLVSPLLFAQTTPVNSSFSTYWQQRADYKMVIDVDVKNYQYHGQQTLTYTNHSPDVLNTIYYHLYYNAFQPDSEMDSRLQTIADPDGRMVNETKDSNKPKYESKIALLKPDETGYIKVNKLTQNGMPLHYKIEGTVLEVKLAQPVLSGEQAIFDMDFDAQIPKMIRRGGRNSQDDIALSMTQWYPKMAVYDHEGWHTDPYIMREFYGEWGNFDVTLHIDKKYVVAGTGYVQNPQEVGCGYENPNVALQIPKTNKKTWHFYAPNVHDFSWAADPDYNHDQLITKDGIVLHFFYKKYKNQWKEMQPFAVKAMEFYNQWLGKYYYDQYSIIQGGDGGMEYGMCTLISGGQKTNGLLSAVIHEMGHAWFQFAVATNESQHPWMDEGFTTFVEILNKQNLNLITSKYPFSGEYQAYYYSINSGFDEPLTTHADHYFSNTSYGINAYSKGCVFLSQLAYIIGWENTQLTLKNYYKLWKGKHPTPNDFIRIAEKTSNLHLGWYLNEFTATTHTIDYAVEIINNDEIHLKRLGEMPMPIDVTITYIDGSEEEFYIPLNLMRGEKKSTATLLKDWDWAHPNYSFKTSKKIKKATIDPSLLMADVNLNNVSSG